MAVANFRTARAAEAIERAANGGAAALYALAVEASAEFDRTLTPVAYGQAFLAAHLAIAADNEVPESVTHFVALIRKGYSVDGVSREYLDEALRSVSAAAESAEGQR